MATQTKASIVTSAKPAINERNIRIYKANAREARRLYNEYRRPGKEARCLDRFMWCRAMLIEACQGDPNRFAAEWRDVMEGK